MGFNHWVGKISWRRAWQPTPLFLLGDPMDRRACWATVHGVQRVRHNWSDWTHTLNLRHPSMFFELWCWWRLLRVPWTAKRSNQSILKEINSEYSLEGLMLKLQYFGYQYKELTYWKRTWCWERLGAGGEEDDRRWDGWMESPSRWTWVCPSSRSWWRTANPGVL